MARPQGLDHVRLVLPEAPVTGQEQPDARLTRALAAYDVDVTDATVTRAGLTQPQRHAPRWSPFW